MPWISQLKKSNLTEFIDSNYIQSPSDYFDTSKQNIRKLIQAQTVHEQRALRCIIEIGKTLSDLYDYKKRSQSPRIDKMWNDLVAEFQYSPATVTKYIKISNNPVLSDERFKNRIPSSVFSLYELSKIEPIALQLLIESNEVTSTSGRTDIVALTTPPKTKKRSTIQIPIMSLSIDKKDWITTYKSFEDDLIEFLTIKDISYSFSSQVKSLDKSEVARSKKIENYIFQQSKAHFNKVVKNHIDNTCRTNNLCSPKTPLKKKMQLLKFGIDEVTTEGCITTAEIEERFLPLGFQEESIWNEHLMKWTADAFEKFPSQIPESVHSNTTEEFDVFVRQHKGHNFTPVKKKRDFSKLKV
jgi:hypothetical protein